MLQRCAGVNTGNTGLQFAPIIYTNTIYNTAGSLPLRYAIDTPPSTYFADLRKTLGLNNAVYGVMNSAADQMLSDTMKTFNIFLEREEMADLSAGVLTRAALEGKNSRLKKIKGRGVHFHRWRPAQIIFCGMDR